MVDGVVMVGVTAVAGIVVGGDAVGATGAGAIAILLPQMVPMIAVIPFQIVSRPQLRVPALYPSMAHLMKEARITTTVSLFVWPFILFIIIPLNLFLCICYALTGGWGHGGGWGRGGRWGHGGWRHRNLEAAEGPHDTPEVNKAAGPVPTDGPEQADKDGYYGKSHFFLPVLSFLSR